LVDVSKMKIGRIVADGDLDGLLSAAIVRRVWENVPVRFSHPAEVRRGDVDDWMTRETAVLDLPFHPMCGLHIDHHLTNKPTPEQKKVAALDGCNIVWEEALSAARVCFNTFQDTVDLTDFDPWMEMVDKLDGGKVSREEFMSENPIVWIGRTIDTTDERYCQTLLEQIVDGVGPNELAKVPVVDEKIGHSKGEFRRLQTMLDECATVVDRMVIVRLDDKGIRTNGYLVTAHFGDECDACMIIHGFSERGGDEGRWPLSASFYSNSFLHEGGGLFDLTRLATAFDVDGGGHANACGCRIQPLGPTKQVEERGVGLGDIERNIEAWMATWAERSRQ
jgi:oligoribonuclease NrnB/cAMP/cGMP phosphodiesterase (DHH superfamily)